jgi:hypothetical protein
MLLAHRPQSRRENSTRRENEREVREMRKLMRPVSLLKAMTTPAVISPEDLKTLVETQYENPVISLYLRQIRKR